MSTTNKLKLNKHDNPSINTNPFDIENYLNANWDKIDQFADNISNAVYKINGTGENVTLQNTAEISFIKPPLPKGNSKQNGEPSSQEEVSIYSVGDSGSINIKKCNKNSLYLTDGTYNSNGITAVVNNGAITLNGTASSTSFITIPLRLNLEVKANTNYTIATHTTINIGTNENYGSIRLNSGSDDTTTDVKFTIANSNITFSKNSAITYTALRVRTASGLTYNNFIVKPQLEQGSTATSYTLHQSEIFNLSCQQPMRAIENTRDIFFKNIIDSEYYNSELEDDAWYEMHNIGQIVFNGTESGWSLSSTNTSGYKRFANSIIYSIIVAPNSSNDIVKALSNYFISKSANATYNCQDGISANTSGTIYIYADELKEYTVEQLKTWLSTHNVELIFILKTPTYLKCTETQVEQLETIVKSKSYYEQTNIFSTDETIPYFDVTAIADMNLLIDSINARLILVEG